MPKASLPWTRRSIRRPATVTVRSVSVPGLEVGELRRRGRRRERRPRSGTGSSRSSHTPVLLEDEAQAVEREPRLVLGDGPRVRRDDRGQPAGGDDRGLADLVDHAVGDAVDLGGEAVERAGLDRLDGVLADDVAGLDQLDLAQRGGPGEEGVEADVDAGEDGAAEVLALGGDGVERGGGAEVDDDRRPAVEVERGRPRRRCGRRRPPWGSRRGSACRSSRRAR